ncbi:MAG: trypsin-like peptidase domain-containing protein [Caldilineales bacterium]|nr:trypsin-like peptidase domain-containing protein [Caldilineales bacterium]MDW8316483.1 trypsin-like peptidase domain-containing protein [Anaerolineae bacterium]
MSSNRGPVVVFVAMFAAIFLCLCAVAAGALAFRLTQDRAPAIELPSLLPTPALQPRLQPATPAARPTRTPAAAPTAPAPVTITIPPGADVESEILRAVYKKVNPSVVKVVNLDVVEMGDTTGELPQGQGSGFVWDTEGHIVTNAHVVEGARRVQVVFYDDVTVTGEVIGSDPNSDLAVIEIDPTGLNLVPVERGNIDEVQVGDRAIAIGAPFDFAGSMTSGIVSGLGRSIRSLNVNFTIPEVIQTDAPINPGNSGGPLLDGQGRVIGVNAQIRTEGNVRANSGVGFAIPIYIVERVVPALIENGRYDHPFIGISGQTYSPEWAEALGFPPDARGAYVIEVLAGQPAERAGLRGATRDTNVVVGVNPLTGEPTYLRAGGDLIIGINDQPVRRFDDLLIYLFRYASPGDTVQLRVLRADGSEEVIPLTLGVRPTR